MCGHVGIFGSITPELKRAFKYMHNFDTLRGEDSSGICVVKGDLSTEVLKSLSVPDNLHREFPDKFDRGVLKEPNVLCMMGHNRFKTQGVISAENAHPFEFEHIIGAHNGTISQAYTDKLWGHEFFDIDSQKLFSQLNHEQDVKQLWEKLPDNQNSAAAIVWWDKRDSSLNFLRNSQRPLYIAPVKGKQALLWASEKWMLEIASAKAGVELGDAFSLVTHSHCKFKWVDGKVDMEVVKDVPHKTFPVYSYSSYTRNGMGRDDTFTILTLKEIHPDANPPALVFENDLGEEVFCRESYDKCPTVTKDIMKLVDLLAPSKVELEVEDNFLWFDNTAGNRTRVVGASAVARAIDNELRSEEAKKKVTPSKNCAVDEKENPVSGRALRRRLKAARNMCSCCFREVYPKDPCVNGGWFLSSDEFFCNECVDQVKSTFYIN